MKHFASICIAVLACIAKQVSADGVCYDPDHNPGKSAATVQADMEAIKARGFDHVRTYISKFAHVNLGKVITAAGLRVSLGVPFPAGDAQAQADAAIEAAKSGNVVYIFVGNENLASTGSVPGDQIALISRIKSQVPPSVKVGTVQRTAEFVERVGSVGGLAQLIGACDVVGVNIHPFFNPGTPAEKAISVTESQWSASLNAPLPGIREKLVLTETGWPTSGSAAGNQGSVAGLNTYFSAYKQWSSKIAGHNKYFFQMFDQPQRNDGEHERTFGLLTADRRNKFEGSFDAPKPPVAAAKPAPPAPSAASASAQASPAPAQPSVALNATNSRVGADAKASTAGGSGSFGADFDLSSLMGSGANSDSEEKKGDKETSTPTFGMPGDSEDKYSEKDSEAVEITTKSSGGGSGTFVGLVVAAGCAAVLAGFGFIIAARRKANQKEESETKDAFELTETPVRSSVLI